MQGREKKIFRGKIKNKKLFVYIEKKVHHDREKAIVKAGVSLQALQSVGLNVGALYLCYCRI
jgi:hypothetical protein